MKKYKAVFFDWDGTAVTSRTAPAEAAVSAMRPLLEKGVKLAVISGTTLENIAGGRIEEYFTKKQLENLYLGLGRGAYNYEFRDGTPYIFENKIPDQKTLLDIHRSWLFLSGRIMGSRWFLPATRSIWRWGCPAKVTT